MIIFLALLVFLLRIFGSFGFLLAVFAVNVLLWAAFSDWANAVGSLLCAWVLVFRAEQGDMYWDVASAHRGEQQ